MTKRVVIESLDGAGKSTTAEGVALNLSLQYRDERIAVIDSTGVQRFQSGQQVGSSWQRIEGLEPQEGQGRLRTAARLGAFTVARRFAETRAMLGADLVIGVRDPFRIDPATYSVVYGLGKISKMSAEDRLKIFDRFTHSPHPTAIIHLLTDSEKLHIQPCQNGSMAYHETSEKLQLIADELPMVLDAYQSLYGSPIEAVTALRPDTIDNVTACIEPVLQPSVNA